MMSIGDRIAAEAEAWIDTPFRQGRVKGVGCDCKGLVAGIAAACGRPEGESLEALADDYSVERRINARRLKAGLARLFDKVPVSERLPGDILLVKVRGVAQHLAIAAPQEGKPSRVIEAQIDVGRVRPFRRSTGETDSVWRWRPLDCARNDRSEECR